MGLPHRYRGGLLMLTTSGPRVVMTKALQATRDAGEPVYSCVVPSGVSFAQPHPGPPPRETVTAHGDQLEPRLEYRESQLVAPDEPAVRAALIATVQEGHAPAAIDRAMRALHGGYIWMTQPDPGPDGPLFDLVLFHLLAAGPGEAADDPDDSPLQAFTDLATANAWHASVGVRGVAARVPFVAACVLADRLGHSRFIHINPGADGEATIPREAYLWLPTADLGG